MTGSNHPTTGLLAAPSAPASGVEQEWDQKEHFINLLNVVRSTPDAEFSEVACQNIDHWFGNNPTAYSFWCGVSTALDEMRAREWLRPEVAALLPDMKTLEEPRNANGARVAAAPAAAAAPSAPASGVELRKCISALDGIARKSVQHEIRELAANALRAIRRAALTEDRKP